MSAIISTNYGLSILAPRAKKRWFKGVQALPQPFIQSLWGILLGHYSGHSFATAFCATVSCEALAPAEQVGTAQSPQQPRVPLSKVRPPPTASTPLKKSCGGRSLTTCRPPDNELPDFVK